MTKTFLTIEPYPIGAVFTFGPLSLHRAIIPPYPIPSLHSLTHSLTHSITSRLTFPFPGSPKCNYSGLNSYQRSLVSKRTYVQLSISSVLNISITYILLSFTHIHRLRARSSAPCCNLRTMDRHATCLVLHEWQYRNSRCCGGDLGTRLTGTFDSEFSVATWCVCVCVCVSLSLSLDLHQTLASVFSECHGGAFDEEDA